MMHPQVQIPPAHQKAQQRGAKQEEQQQRPEEYNQYQRWQEVSYRKFELSETLANKLSSNRSASAKPRKQQMLPKAIRPDAASRLSALETQYNNGQLTITMIQITLQPPTMREVRRNTSSTNSRTNPQTKALPNIRVESTAPDLDEGVAAVDIALRKRMITSDTLRISNLLIREG